MNPTEYAIIGVLVALVGILIYEKYTLRAYSEEKKRIEEDISLSQKYAPKKALGMLYVALVNGANGAIFVLLALVLFYANDMGSIRASLSAKYILILGFSVLIANLSVIPIATEAMKDIVYFPSVKVPKEIRDIKDMDERTRKEKEFYENEGIKNGSKNFGKHLILMSMPETLIIFAFIVFFLISNNGKMTEALAENLFTIGLVFVLLAAMAIPIMKKAAEIPIEKLPKKLIIAYLAYVPATVGFVIIIMYMIMGA